MNLFNEHVPFNVLKGKTLIAVEKFCYYGDHLVFKTSDGDIYLMAHDQDCCEEVYIDDVCGDFEDLLNEEILVADELSGDVTDEERSIYGSCSWTFFHLATLHGDVTIKWFGTSNGFYSESANLYKINSRDYECIKDDVKKNNILIYKNVWEQV